MMTMPNVALGSAGMAPPVNSENSVHICCPQRREYLMVKYYMGGHNALTEVLPASQAVRCRAYISNKEASGRASRAEGGNVPIA